MNCITTHPMRENDIAAVAEIERRCFSKPWSVDMLRAELSNDAAYFIVAHNSETIVGYAGMHTVVGECYIANIAVDPSYRRQGVAAAMLGELESFALTNECDFLTLEVRLSNLAAISLYTSFGFIEVGVRRGYYSHPVEDAVIMSKFYRNEV